MSIFRGLRYYIHKTVTPNVFAWLRSLLIWNGAELGCHRPDHADIIILHFPTAQQNRRVPDLEAERTEEECRARNVWETADLYALLARRTNSAKDKDKLARRCIVQSEWVQQCVRAGKRLEGGDKGGWEIKVTNDRLASTADLASEMPGSILIDPVGGLPSLSFDLGAGSVDPPRAQSEITWTYPEQAGSSSEPSMLDPNNIYGLPTEYSNEPLPYSSNTSGVFCKDQVLPLSFYVLDADTNPDTVETITQNGGGVMMPLRQATFVIATIRGKRSIDESDDPELYRAARNMDVGRAIVSIEWVDKCIADGALSSIDPFRVTPTSEDDLVEAALRARQSSTGRLSTPRLSPPPRKPDISGFVPMRSPEPMARPRQRKMPRRNVVDLPPRKPVASSSTSNRASPFNASVPPAPMLPTPRSSPVPHSRRTASPAASVRHASPDVTEVPARPAVRRPAARQHETQVIDLTLSDSEDGEDAKDDEVDELDEEGKVEQILPEQTPVPRSPTPVTTARRLPTWRTSSDIPTSFPIASPEVQVPVSPAQSQSRASRGPTPSLFRLTPGGNKRKGSGA